MKFKKITKNLQKIMFFYSVFSLFFLKLNFALAQGMSKSGKFDNPLGDANMTFSALLIRVTGWVLGISAFLALLALVIGGIRLIISFGNPTGVESAKKNILWAVIGVVVIILSYAIIRIVAGLLGVTL